jgi:hypothetical protein
MPCLERSSRHSPVPAETRDWPLASNLTLVPLPSAVPCARAHAVARLCEWGLSRVLDTAELVVSEMITNAVMASSALAGGPFPVGLWLLSDRRELLIMAHDASPQPPSPVEPAEDAEGGRGLMLVEALSKQWGFYPAGTTGKVVWALCEVRP